MSTKKLGKQSYHFPSAPSILAYGNVAGKKEHEGPLGKLWDEVSLDDTFGEDSWEKSESTMQKKAMGRALEQASLTEASVDLVFAGDLLNQCTATMYAQRSHSIPLLGLYGACSTMGEALLLSAMAVDGGFAQKVLAVTSSHFCTAERQYRTPLEYGGQRPPTTQWTVTGSGAIFLGTGEKAPFLTHASIGHIVDMGITDVNNMGAAMAPAALATIKAHFEDTGRSADFYDLIITGDLGVLGKEILLDLAEKEGISLGNYDDCGAMIYDVEAQDVHSGGSGCGCCALVLTAYLLPKFSSGEYQNILFCPTGALHSPTAMMQGESIPCISHALAISAKKPSL